MIRCILVDDEPLARERLRALLSEADTSVTIEAREKLVYVHLPDGDYRIDFTLDELDARLDARQFLRVHRSHIVNARYVVELIAWFAGAYLLRLDDGTQLPVARRRVRDVKELLGG